MLTARTQREQTRSSLWLQTAGVYRRTERVPKERSKRPDAFEKQCCAKGPTPEASCEEVCKLANA